MRPVALILLLSQVACDASCVESALAERRGKAFGQRPGGAVNVASAAFDLPNEFAIDLPAGATDMMELADDAALEPTNGQLSFYLRTRTNLIAAGDIYLSKWRETTDRAFVVDQESLVDGHTRVRMTICGANTCSPARTLSTSRGVWMTDTWTSIAGVVDVPNQIARLYVDGAEAGVTPGGTWGTDWVDTAADWAVGARDDGNGALELNGQVDDVMLFPSELLTSECIFDLHNKRGSRTLPATCPTPSTWCRGGDDDAGTGTTCTDRTGQGRDWALVSNAAFSAASVPARLTAATADSGNLDRQVILFLGQSNMSGRGVLEDIADQAVTFPNRDRVWNYDNDGPIGTPNGTENPAVEPIDDDTGQSTVFPVSDETAGVGPMLGAADFVAGVWINHEIGIVPCPLGGTDALAWVTSHDQVTQRLFGECETRWQSAVLGAGTAEVAAIVVYQGEQDAQDTFEATNWAYRWQATIEGVRDDLGERDVPAVFVVLPVSAPSSGDFSEWATVRAQQQTVCDYLDHCSTVQAPDGPWIDTQLHLATSAQLVLGDLIGAAILATDYAATVTP